MAIDFRLTWVDDRFEISCPALPGWSCSGHRDTPFKRDLAASLDRYLQQSGRSLPADVAGEVLAIIADTEIDTARNAA